jgi:teichuronic acid biosynthesis glycosyltransferase TuaG
MPRVSIVIPAYNAEAYLPEALASVEAQTYSDWEVIVADDASTDGTVQAAQARGERFKVLTGAINEGPAAARNRALEVASGELLSLLDADDLWLPTYLERTVQLYDDSLARGLRPGIVTSDARLLTPEGFLPRTYMELMGFPAEVTVERMLVSNQIYVSALAPRALVDEVGRFCAEIFGTEDYDLWLRIVERGYDVVFVDEPLAVYRLRPASVSSNLARMARSLQSTYRRALERGTLTPRQRRIALRQLRLQRALEQVGLLRSERGDGRLPLGRLLRALPLFARVAVENPDRWGAALRVLAGRGSPLAQVGK